MVDQDDGVVDHDPRQNDQAHLGRVATRLAGEPPDREHPYGHRKFETLAVFGLGTLLAVLALEMVLGAFSGAPRRVVTHGWRG